MVFVVLKHIHTLSEAQFNQQQRINLVYENFNLQVASCSISLRPENLLEICFLFFQCFEDTLNKYEHVVFERHLIFITCYDYFTKLK